MPAVGLGVQLKRLFSKEVGIIESPTWTAAFHPAARSQDTVCPDERGIVLPRLQYGFASSQGVLLVVVLVSMLHGRLSVVATMSYSGFSSPPHHHLSLFGIMSDIFNILLTFCLVPLHPACLYGL